METLSAEFDKWTQKSIGKYSEMNRITDEVKNDLQKHVKQFIKVLKEMIESNFIGDKPKLVTVNNALYYIDKLAGEKLI